MRQLDNHVSITKAHTAMHISAHNAAHASRATITRIKDRILLTKNGIRITLSLMTDNPHGIQWTVSGIDKHTRWYWTSAITNHYRYINPELTATLTAQILTKG